MLPNFHTHTYRCNHCKGDVADYVKRAKEEGAVVLGFSDHSPLPPGRWSEHRMRLDEFDGYLKAIEESSRNNPDMKIYAGLECEFSDEILPYIEENIINDKRLDYLIGAEHWIPYDGDWLFVDDTSTYQHLIAYADNQIAMMESGLYIFIAHPDLYMQGYSGWDSDAIACSRDIFSAAESLQIPLEINGNGFSTTDIRAKMGLKKKYPYLPFWETAADYDIQVVCSSDAHHPSEVLSPIERCLEIAVENDLEVVNPEDLLILSI